MGSYDRASEGYTYKSAIMSFLFRLTELTCIEDDMHYLLDNLWANINPYITDFDRIWWEKNCDAESYEGMMNKIRIISIILYRIGLLPQKEHNIGKRQYEELINPKIEFEIGGLEEHIIQDLELKNFIFRHMKVLSFITKNQLESTMHIDGLWSFLAPYITEEDFYEWDTNNEELAESHPYFWNIEKQKIIMGVLDKNDFLMEKAFFSKPKRKHTPNREVKVNA